MTELLKTENLAKAFGKVQALTGLTMDVRQGEILGILGPNGSGKTTLFNVLTGVYPPDRGKIYFEGSDITKSSADQRSRKGIGRTYQIPRPFGNMTVLENLLVAATHGGGLTEKRARIEADQILVFTGLSNCRHHFARTLRLLDRKRLELARAMATKPSLLLLDEVAAGLTEAESRQVLEIVHQIRDNGVTVVWIEHILMMMSGVDRILALDQGGMLICGGPQEVMNAKEVLQCYLGIQEG